MPIWFLLLTGFCGAIGIWRAVKNGGFFVGGAKINTPTVVVAISIIAVAFGVIIAIQLGFIQDHAP